MLTPSSSRKLNPNSKPQLGLYLLSALAIAGCSSAPKNPREQFEHHWKQSYGSVQVMEVQQEPGGYYRGSGIVDQRPITEFLNPATGQFTDNIPRAGQIADDTPPPSQYQSIMTTLAKSLSDSFNDAGSFAVMAFGGPSADVGQDIADHVEAGLINSGRGVVERKRIDLVRQEHKMQQTDAALFDNTTLARLGKWSGANAVVYGKYSVVGNQVQVTARLLSVETTRVVAVKEAALPLTGPGSDTFLTSKVNAAPSEPAAQ